MIKNDISKQKIAILTSLGLLIAGLGVGTPETDAGGGVSGCTLQSPLTDPLLVLSVGTIAKFYTHILEKEVFNCSSNLIVDVSTIIRDTHNKGDILKKRVVNQVVCIKSPISSPAPNCSVNIIAVGIVSGISLFDDCLDVNNTWVDGDTAKVKFQKNEAEVILSRTVMVQKELWTNCIGGPTYEIFTIKHAIDIRPIQIDVVVCEKDESTAQIIKCDQVEPGA